MMVCICRKRLPKQPRHGCGWLVVAILTLLNSGMVVSAVAVETRSASCRIYNRLNGQNNIGSGTLIDRGADGRQGLVLTCAHLFSDGTGHIVVDFPGNKTHRARLVGIDRQADLAALVIANPTSTPVSFSTEITQGANLFACGYGSNGQYRCAVGSRSGQATAPGQISLLIPDGVRSGDSGGGVFDSHGNLVAVVWGEAQGVTYASYGRPLQSFLSRMLGRPSTQVASCPNGRCRQPSRPVVIVPSNRAPTLAPPPRQTPAPRPQPDRSILADGLQRQIDELRQSKQDRGDYALRSDLSGYAPSSSIPDVSGFAHQSEVARYESESTSRHQSILERLATLSPVSGLSAGKAAGAAAVGLLGLSGPVGWAVLAGGTLGGWLIGRRVRRKTRGAGGRRRQVFPG